jgi:hypothetical protein
MSFELRPGLYHVRCQDDIILLDLRQDRYFAIPRPLIPAFRRLIEDGEDDDRDYKQLSAVLDPDGLQRRQAPGPDRCHPVSISNRLIPSQCAANITSLARAVLFRTLAALWLRTASLERILAAIERRKRSVAHIPQDPEKAGGVAYAFSCITPFFPVDDRCLSISLALMMAMIERRLPATLVIGVRTAPFSAHCWIQIEDALVNDEPDVVRSFSPILAI